ncbi:MAG TPA: phosphoribosylpyrophosphate synthetase [Daejeonella sp.]|nr:phosphoribosylpyrophosphate synthetase [Daejeonella sp.]
MSASPYNYTTPLEAINALRERGYTYDYHFENACLHCGLISETFDPKDLRITEYYRFEGISDPEDNTVVYAIESNQGHKGVMIDAYGAYSDEHKAAFIMNIPVAEED